MTSTEYIDDESINIYSFCNTFIIIFNKVSIILHRWLKSSQAAILLELDDFLREYRILSYELRTTIGVGIINTHWNIQKKILYTKLTRIYYILANN